MAEQSSVDKAVPNEIISPEQLLEMAKSGELPVEYTNKFPTTFTPENMKAFAEGKITWAELQGMSLQEAYAIADLAYTLYEQGRYKDSQVLCEGLVMGNPHHAYFHTLLAGVYEKQNLTDKAIDEYNVSIFLDPKGISALVNRADLLLKKGRVQQAVEDLRNAMALDPKSETPSGTRARALAAVTATIMEQVLNK